MRIPATAKGRLGSALVTTRRRLVHASALAVAQVIVTDILIDLRLTAALDRARARMAPPLAAVRGRLAPILEAAKERFAPAMAVARERLDPLMVRLEPTIERVKAAAADFGEAAVGAAPEAELVHVPVGEIEAFLEIEAAKAEMLALTGRRDAEDAELEVPPRESWALSTLEVTG